MKVIAECFHQMGMVADCSGGETGRLQLVTGALGVICRFFSRAKIICAFCAKRYLQGIVSMVELCELCARVYQD